MRISEMKKILKQNAKKDYRLIAAIEELERIEERIKDLRSALNEKDIIKNPYYVIGTVKAISRGFDL